MAIFTSWDEFAKKFLENKGKCEKTGGEMKRSEIEIETERKRERGGRGERNGEGVALVN